MKKAISNEEYQIAKERALSTKPLVTPINLSQIQVSKDSIANEVIFIGDKPVPVSPGFFSNFARLLGLQSTPFLRANDAQAGEAFKAFTDALKGYKTASSRSRGNVYLQADPETHCVTGIKPKPYSGLAFETVFDQVERIANDHSMDVSAVNRTKNGGLEVNMCGSGIRDFGGDESFNFGFTMRSAYDGTDLASFAYRLVCENGMTSQFDEENFRMNQVSADKLLDMNRHIDALAGKDFVPNNFHERLTVASNVAASYAEAEDAYKTCCKLLGGDDYTKANDRKRVADAFFPGLVDANRRLAVAGYDPQQLTVEQKRNVRTNQSVWDVINSLTDIGSNENGLQISRPWTLQKAGGKLLSEEFDLQNVNMLSV